MVVHDASHVGHSVAPAQAVKPALRIHLHIPESIACHDGIATFSILMMSPEYTPQLTAEYKSPMTILSYSMPPWQYVIFQDVMLDLAQTQTAFQ